jgi:hypothetical protein
VPIINHLSKQLSDYITIVPGTDERVKSTNIHKLAPNPQTGKGWNKNGNLKFSSFLYFCQTA